MTKPLDELLKTHVDGECYAGDGDTLKKLTEQAIKFRDDQWSAVVNELREALKKISGYSTLDGEKYNSYQDGWHGVADFAKRELTKADQLLKEMGMNL